MHLTLITTLAFLATVLPADAWAGESTKMKMTTPVPEGIATPDTLETRLGTLRFFDGVPNAETSEKVYEFLDFQHAVQAYLDALPIASMSGLRAGLLSFGPANRTAILFEELGLVADTEHGVRLYGDVAGTGR